MYDPKDTVSIQHPTADEFPYPARLLLERAAHDHQLELIDAMFNDAKNTQRLRKLMNEYLSYRESAEKLPRYC